MTVPMLSRPLAITDVETTGRDADRHEIIEIALVLADQRTLEILDTFEAKVRPTRMRSAEPEALKVNGYRPEDWIGAVPLEDAVKTYAEMTAGAMFAAHNMSFDWSFIAKAFAKAGIEHRMDYHRLDLFTLAWARLKDSGIERLNLNEIARFLGIPEEPVPHRAIHGAMTAHAALKRLAVFAR